jgi:hypothetical protein
VDIAENSMPGSVDIDLNPLSVDTVVLHDGKVLLGSVTSVSSASVSINVKGKTTQIARTRVARIVFGQRKAAGNPKATRRAR